MKKNLKWRLGKLPTPMELSDLIRSEIITKEEARDILFKIEDQEDRDKESLKEEIKFLRELVESLSKNSTKIIETIKYIEKPYYHWNWYPAYQNWCNNSAVASVGSNITYATGSLTSVGASNSAVYTMNTSGNATSNFSSISTF